MFSEKRKYFSDTVLPLQGRMYAAALAITGSADDAADAVQTTMMRVWEGIAQGSRPANPAAYCIASVRNASLTIIARRRTGIAIDGNDGIDPPSDAAADSRAELSDARRLMGSLPERERKAVEMNAFAGCSADEIAEALDVTAANARQILSRAHERTVPCSGSKRESGLCSGSPTGESGLRRRTHTRGTARRRRDFTRRDGSHAQCLRHPRQDRRTAATHRRDNTRRRRNHTHRNRTRGGRHVAD